MKLPPLTPKEKELLHVIRANQHVAIPSVRELARLMGGRASSTVHQHLISLRRKGYLDNGR